MVRMLLLTAILTAAVHSIKAQQPLSIKHLTGNFYVFTTYRKLPGGPFPSNGMYMVTKDGVALFDTPWDTTQVLPLLDSIYARHGRAVAFALSTHFHDDRTAGLELLKRNGVHTWSSRQTYELCRSRNERYAGHTFGRDTSFSIGGYTFSTWHPGAGHTADNILVWFEKDKILYGGCFVKSTENNSLGNVADADIAEWKTAVEKTIKQYPKPAYVIPGHFGWQQNNSLQHTLKLVNAALKKQ